MIMLFKLVMLIWICPGIQATETLDNFIEDLIASWKLISPTIIILHDALLPEYCLRHNWVLCLQNDMNMNQLSEHIVSMHQDRKQDGVVFVGHHGQETLFEQLGKLAPSIFVSNCPVFAPIEYADIIKLRLDSNIMFYQKETAIKFNLFDIFAVKGGPPITLELATWDTKKGMRLKQKANRWDRRTNLKGATFINSVYEYEGWGELIMDENGTIVGSKGFFQEKLFYMTDKLNLTIRTVESPDEAESLLPNGSWTGEVGTLQRKEVDVSSSGFGIDIPMSEEIDFSIATLFLPLEFITAIPKGTAPNTWVYVRVFGVLQWAIFLALLIAAIAAFTACSSLSQEIIPTSKKHLLLKGFTMAYEYTLQLGEHPNVMSKATRLFTLTLSMLTMLMFTYYTTEITAEMTSAPPGIPIKTLEDIFLYDYKVIASDEDQYYIEWFGLAKPGTTQHTIYKTFFQTMADIVPSPTPATWDNSSK